MHQRVAKKKANGQEDVGYLDGRQQACTSNLRKKNSKLFRATTQTAASSSKPSDSHAKTIDSYKPTKEGSTPSSFASSCVLAEVRPASGMPWSSLIGWTACSLACVRITSSRFTCISGK
jgi:hypothetical protein